MTTAPNLPAPPPARPILLREGVALALCAILVTVLVARLDPGLSVATYGADGATLALVLLNAVPALAAFALLLAITRRLVLSVWLVLLLVAALYAANAAKLGMLETPLLPADLRLLADPGPAVELLSKYLHVDTLRALLIGAGVLLTIALFRERRLRLLAGWRAPALGAAALLLGGSLVAGASPWRRVYEPAQASFHPWQLAESTSNTGLIGSLLLYHWEIGGGEVPSADHAAALALLEAHGPALREGIAAGGADAERPDIVVVQSESLFDPALLREVPEGRWLPNYHRLTARGTSGELTVPTFVGGTIRTEFEVLTGAPLASLGGIQYPWLELGLSKYPGITRVLDAHGYETIAVHPNAAAFWNRARAFPALGFERFIDGAAFDPKRIVGLFTADAAMTDRVLEELGEDGPPRFIFAISMENHGPFDWRPNLDAGRLAALPMPPGLDAGGRLWFGNYLYLLDDADAELGRLAKALAARKRHTLLLFYGDHLPGLGPVYVQLGFDDGRPADVQPVPWLLLDNRDARAHVRNAHSWMLPALLLEAAGIHDDAWFQLLATLARDPAFDPDDLTVREGLFALARLQLRGELDPLVAQVLGAPPTLAQAPAADAPH